MTGPGASEISQQLEKVESIISTASRLVDEGKMVDLAALQDRVAELTEMIKLANPETASPFRPSLQKLIDSLDNLEAGMEALHREVTKAEALMEQKKARSAYKNDPEND